GASLLAVHGSPVEHVSFMLVVGPTPQRDVRNRGRATYTVRLPVMELHEGPFVAAPPSLADKATAPVIVLRYRPPDRRRDGAGSQPGAAAGPRPIGGRELLPLQFGEQERKSAVEDLGQVPVGDGMAEEVLGQA